MLGDFELAGLRTEYCESPTYGFARACHTTLEYGLLRKRLLGDPQGKQ
jgi:hypothetical protein